MFWNEKIGNIVSKYDIVESYEEEEEEETEEEDSY